MVTEQTTESLYITWSAPSSDGGSPITGYRVRTQDMRTFEIVPRTIGIVNEFNITGLFPFTPYIIAVAAINDFDRGEEIIITDETLSERELLIVIMQYLC